VWIEDEYASIKGEDNEWMSCLMRDAAIARMRLQELNIATRDGCYRLMATGESSTSIQVGGKGALRVAGKDLIEFVGRTIK
jgi:hypothetical protein